MDIARGADILANVAADALPVIGYDVAADGALFLWHAVDRFLRAVDEAGVALKAHPAAHAAHALVLCLSFRKGNDALAKIAHHLFSGDVALLPPVARNVGEMPFV